MRLVGEASPVGIVVVAGNVTFEFSRLSNPPNEDEPVIPVGNVPAGVLVVAAFILLSFRLFRSKPIPPPNGGIAAGGVLAGISNPPSRSNRS